MGAQSLSSHGVGGSEAAAVLGLHPYVTPIALWQRKRALQAGLPDPFPVVENDAIRWGNYLEDPVRQAYARRYGVDVSVPPHSVYHREHTWRRATPDGLVFDGPRIAHGVEIKTASHRMAHYWGADGSEEVPDHYAVQCLWYCHVLDVDRWDLAALIGGSDFRCYTIKRDRELESAMVATVAAFWEDNVLGGAEPPVDGSEDFRTYLVHKWPGRGGVIVADAHLEFLVQRIARLRSKANDSAEALRAAENELRSALGDDTVLETSMGRVTCKPRAGRAMTNWEGVARQIASLADMDASVPTLAQIHTSRAKASRPLLFPRAMESTDE